MQGFLEEAVDNALDETPRTKMSDDGAVEAIIKRVIRTRMSALWGKRPPVAALIHRV